MVGIFVVKIVLEVTTLLERKKVYCGLIDDLMMMLWVDIYIDFREENP